MFKSLIAVSLLFSLTHVKFNDFSSVAASNKTAKTEILYDHAYVEVHDEIGNHIIVFGKESLPNVTSSSYIEFYAGARIYSINKKSWIDKNDFCRIKKIENAKALIEYPSGKKRVERWFYLKDLGLPSLTASYDVYTATNNIQTYRSWNKGATAGSIYKNDKVYILSQKSGMVAVLWPLTNTGNKCWRLSYIKSSDLSKMTQSKKEKKVQTKISKKATTSTQKGYSWKIDTNKSSFSQSDSSPLYRYEKYIINCSTLDEWMKSMKSSMEKALRNGGVIQGVDIISYKLSDVKIPRSVVQSGPNITGYAKVSLYLPREVEFKVHWHKNKYAIFPGGSAVFLRNNSIVLYNICECGYTQELIAWEIPDPEGFQTSQKIIQGLPNARNFQAMPTFQK